MRVRVRSAAVVNVLHAACAVAVLSVFSGVCVAAMDPSVPSVSPAAVTVPLPDAPDANVSIDAAPVSGAVQTASVAFDLLGSAAIGSKGGTSGAPKLTTFELDQQCQSGVLRGKPCRTHWLPVLWQSFEATATQNVGNIALDDETRNDLVTHPYWATYIKCVHQFRYRQWRDDDDFMVDYVGHGMQGAIAASVFEQNGGTGRGLVYVNNGNYWRSRLKAMAWITVYEVQWKIGPAGEASIGNSGLNTYYTPRVQGRSTNETGFQDFVDTPVVGFWWNVGEDAIDRFIMPHIWSRTHNRLILTALLPLTPCKAFANILRYKPFYYRDFPLTPLR